MAMAGGKIPPRFSALLAGSCVIPVLSIETADDAVPLARALIDGGLNVLEVTLRTDCAIEAAKRIIAEVPGAVLGIGTVTRAEEFDKVMALGARFAVSPGLTPALGAAARASGMPYLPGVSTPSEAMAARELGFYEMKLYPAMLSGGPKALMAMAPVFPDVGFCPTGGVTAANLNDFLKLGNVFAVGGTWVAPAELVAGHRWDAITALAAEAAGIAQAAVKT
jgi:2-dehydro-3-deoxyphosphogluconate aldolase/(4S)-4-hydroxy-2-oxoglutarate aldolase